MTTPPDPDGTGSIDDAPYLPPASPAAPAVPEQPGVPEPGRAPEHTAPAMPAPLAPPTAAGPGSAGAPGSVAGSPTVAQHQSPVEPAYGSLPPATDATADASRRLRSEAQRRRRRNARVGWVLAIGLFGAAVVTAWFVYRAFEEDTTGVPPATVAGNDNGSAAQGRAGGDAGATAAAETPVDGAAIDSSASADPEPVADAEATADAAPPISVDRPDYRTLTYDVRVYAGVEADAPYRHFSATYDVVADDYFGFFEDSASGQTSLISFDGDWRYEAGSDGIFRRVMRSKFSLQPEPDTRLAELIDETDVLPEAARPFAVLVTDEPADDAFPSIDGSVGRLLGYQLDVDAFRAADPAAHAAWRSLWSTALPDSRDLIVPGSDQVQLRESTPVDLGQVVDPLDLGDIEVEATSGVTAIAYHVADRGIVDGLVIVSPEDDVRVVYVASDYDDGPSSVTFDDGLWVDAP